MIDLLLVSVPGLDNTKPPPALYVLKSYLENKGMLVEVIDANFMDLDELILHIETYDFKWLGISVFSYMQIKDSFYIGDNFDNVVYGGSGVDKDNYSDKNYICGDGEMALYQFLKGNLNYPGINGNAPIQNGKFDSITLYGKIDDRYNSVVITGSKGCVRHCSFCDIHHQWPKFQYIEGKRLAEMCIETSKDSELHNKRRKSISFSDSLINGSLKQFKIFMKRLIADDYKIKYAGQFVIHRKALLSKEFFDNLRDSGCAYLSIGVESGSEKVRKHIGKHFTNEDLYYTIDNCLSRGIMVKFLLIVGYPTETHEDYLETLEMIKRYNTNPLVDFSPHMMYTTKNTPIDAMNKDGKLFDIYGDKWSNDISNHKLRLERFIGVYELMINNTKDFVGSYIYDKLDKAKKEYKEILRHE